MDPALYWSPDPPGSGWKIIQTESDWRGEQLDGPRAINAPSLMALVKLLAGEDEALQRRYTEQRIRSAASVADVDPEPLITALRASEKPR